MKKIIRDILFIVLLFAAVLAAPAVMENVSDGEALPPVQEQQAASTDGLQEGDTIATADELPMPAPAPADANETRPADCPTLGKQPYGFPVTSGSGFDSLITEQTGEIVLDGSRFIGMEHVNLRHGDVNTIRIRVSGLSSLQNNTHVIEGDPGMDTVFLDPCLSWKPSQGDGNGNLLYEGEDIVGNRAYVFVNEGVAVVGGN